MAAARAESQVALGQTATAVYARTAGGGAAASRLAGSLVVHLAGARSGNRVSAAPVGSAARQGAHAVADSLRDQTPCCGQCGQPMKRQDTESVSWTARFGRLHAPVARYRCPACKNECRPLLELLGVEPGRLSGSLARLLGLLAVGAPYPLAAQLALMLVSFRISPMGVWEVGQRVGESAARHSDALSP